MQAVLTGFVGSLLLVWGTGRVRDRLPVVGRLEVGLASHVVFLALAVPLLAERGWLAIGLLTASAVIVAWGGLLTVFRRSSSWAMVGGDALAAAAVVALGLKVPVLTDPSGGYIYLRGLAAPLTWAWLLCFMVLLKLANRLPGLFAGVAALLSYLLLGSLLYQQQHGPNDFRLLALVAGVSSGMWLNSFSTPSGRLGRVACSLWSLTLGSVAVLSTSKKVATVAVLSPIGLGLAPLAFFSFVIARSYFWPRVTARREERLVLRMAFTSDRVVAVLLLFCLLVNVITLLVLFAPSPAWVVGLSGLAGALFVQVATLVLLRPKGPVPKVGRTVTILGIPFLRRSLDRHLVRVREWLRGGPARMIITPDSLALLRSLEDPEYRALLESADLLLPDGAGVIWASDFLCEKPLLERIPGIEFTVRLLQLAEETGAGVFLLGTTDEVLARTRDAFVTRFPRLRLVGTHHGFFDLDAADEVVAGIRASGADLCLVAMGVPRQERFMRRWGAATGAKVLMGIGGSLDVLSGTLERAPPAFQHLGLEWLYRTIAEPWRLTRIFHLPRFVLRVLEEKLSR